PLNPHPFPTRRSSDLQQSYAGRAYAQSFWLADGVDFHEIGWFCGAGGTWTLGENKVKVNGITIDAAGPVSGSYPAKDVVVAGGADRKSTRLNSSHQII